MGRQQDGGERQTAEGSRPADAGQIELAAALQDRLRRTWPFTRSWLLSIRACSISRSGENQKPL